MITLLSIILVLILFKCTIALRDKFLLSDWKYSHRTIEKVLGLSLSVPEKYDPNQSCLLDKKIMQLLQNGHILFFPSRKEYRFDEYAMHQLSEFTKNKPQN